MARQKDRQEPSGARKAKRLGRALSVPKALLLILVVEIVALGLKAYDDRQNAYAAKEVQTQREALAVAEYLAGKINTVERTLTLGYQAGWSPSQIANTDPDIDAVAGLADALSIGPGSRLGNAGDFASRLLVSDRDVGLSESGDIVILHRVESGSSRFALVDRASWLPDSRSERRFQLYDRAAEQVSNSTEAAITACSPLSKGNLTVCIETDRPAFTWADIATLLVYALLILGPALAILGLWKLIEDSRKRTEAFEGQASRAGRILTTVLKEAQAGFWSWHEKNEALWLNQEAATLFGLETEGTYPLAEFLNHVYEGHRDSVRQAFNGLSDRGHISIGFATLDKKSWFDLRAHPDDETGEINGILLDMTEMRTAIARTRQAESRLKSALEGFSGPFALWDQRKRLIYWNRAFMRAFSLEETIRVGMGYDTVALAQGSAILERRSTRHQDGSEIVRTKSGTWFKIVERTTHSGGMITMGLDVSADVQTEVELTQQQSRLHELVRDLERSRTMASDLAEKLEEEKHRAEESSNAKSAFLANVSHELRTPLNAIIGFSEMLIDEMHGPLENEYYQGYARDIHASGRHLLDLIEDILDMAKAEAGKFTVNLRPIDLNDPVDSAVRMLRRKAEEKGIELSFTSQDDLPLIEADHKTIRQMILNLVSNAIKFTDQGGQVDVSLSQSDQQICMRVRDTGIGIPSDALPRLARPFEQIGETRERNLDGTGLGLALTKSFAEMHGGHMSISSQVGEGTQVSIYLPIPKAETSAASSVA